MKHGHISIHMIGTVIISSLTVISLAVLEYIHLNTALAYEQEVVLEQFLSEPHEMNTQLLQNSSTGSEYSFKEEIYSHEVLLNAAQEIPEEARIQKYKMESDIARLLREKQDNLFIQKFQTIGSDKKEIVLDRIEKKISDLHSSGVKGTEYNKTLGKLLAMQVLFSQ